MRLSEVTASLKGMLLCDGDFDCIAFATEQTQKNFLTFLEKEKFLPALDNPGISCVLTTKVLSGKIPAHIRGVYVCDAPKSALFALHNALAEDEAYVGPSFPTRIGENCTISPLAVIPEQNVVIGNGVTIEPFAVINGRVTIGDCVTIRSSAIIGCKGFSFSKDANGNNLPVTGTAQIVVEDDVELFEQSIVTTGIFPWEKTVIGKNTKIAQKAMIGHGAHIGQRCLIAAGARCCGNCVIGDDVWVGVNATVSNRILIGNRARVSIGSVVTKNVPDEMTVSGNFAIPHQRFLQNLKESVKEQESHEY